ncbi:integrase [Gossypium australe]|uniref:Integrase n=1 Tax=Gossypium australe TaxID=47621 RepID=A0A5B6WJQ2_9ROSI|nr:integrase [Gossypium australe]
MIDLLEMFTHVSLFNNGSLLAELQVKLTRVDQIQVKQLSDEPLDSETSNFRLNSDRVLCFKGQICVPNDVELRQSIL